ncbi:uncharacterized protein [Anabrus simplex]|uniref:uncharacterized protein n=1 Tax=Anabrus simplex TaxID=316456 RepID=UPI0034DD78A1
MELNRTVYQQHLLGKTYYTSGFVVNSSQWSRHPHVFQQNVKDETAYIIAKMDISNLTLFYNFFANLSIAKTSGTAIHLFPRNLIAMHLGFNATSGKAEVKSMSPSDVRGPLTDYSPKTNVSSAIARMARLRASGILWKDLVVWMNQTFIPMANSIIEEVPMPLHELN